MSSRNPKPATIGDGYFEKSRRPINCLLFIIPALLFYHISARLIEMDQSLLARRDISRLLGYFGATAEYLAPLLIITVLLGQHIAKRDRWQVNPGSLGIMMFESILWTLPLIAFALLQSQLSAGSASWYSSDEYVVLVGDVGAGVYEEFLFRLIFISLMLVVFVDILKLKEGYVIVASVLISAVIFGLYHVQISSEDTQWARFITRVPMGALWSMAYVYRGFGVAVGAHIAWNLYVNGYNLFV